MTSYVPNELLSRLVGQRLYAVEFVLNDYVQFRFDKDEAPGHVTFNTYVWPVVRQDGRVWREQELGYADTLRRLAPGTVISTTEETGSGIHVELDTGTIVIHPAKEEIFVEIAELSGFPDGRWMAWRPGEDSFEDLA
ncbi:hypothetical protein [Pseudarthrobacter defluvii]|uniref:hypothetical protein n=1 Tax=Pseudarthrobacter defluvii TaxID=410837 RepID=UPI002576048C|nr:hypothetical protein [Pseudarthrobacter defluvii]WJH23696.1 hypothetical protein JCQ34_14765 [Pseudarthrobacter defluvii]